jgi:NAD(P)-dependent dehydrogenase (short-subunit alcohol dehydrogenase family)
VTVQKTYFVTGASTGIGRDIALSLAAKGHRVFAGVRKPADGAALKREAAGLVPVLCDVIDRASIERALAQIHETVAGEGLDGLINNAGISVSGPLELLPLEQFELQMRVNVHGQLAVTQAFLPLLRAKQGRVVFMGSESGLVTLPFLGAYSASKHALEAVANAFRLELRRFGIQVSLIEPGSIQTEIWKKALDTGTAHLKSDPELRAPYAEDLKLLGIVPRLAAKAAVPPAVVTRAVEHALTARRPKARYLVGPEARALTAFIALTPTRLSDYLVTQSMSRLSRRKPRT